MPPVRKVLTCKAFIKDEKDLTLKACSLPLVSDGLGGWRCTRRDDHVLKYKTGFCANGDCEGSARKTAAGKARPSCKWWKRCPCSCHQMYDLMFRTAEMERQVVDNSGYAPDTGEFQMPTLEERIAMIASSMPAAPSAPRIIESPAPDIVPATVTRAFTPTPSGRAARGELALWVKTECDIWAVDQPGYKCTPVYVAEAIAKTQGFVRPPSVGAVDAVFKRWERIGFAIIERKPTRFSSYTPDGIRLGLEGCIERAKRAARTETAEAGRSFRR